MDDAESQISHGDDEINAARGCPFWCFVVLLLLGALVVGAAIIVPVEYYRLHTRYSVAVDSISSADPKTGLSFNLTLGVASRSYGSEACVNPGAYITVAYRGVQLAATGPKARPLYAGPRKAVEQQVLAMATAVPVGKMLDGLAADMKRGVAVFDATLHLPAGSFEGVLSPYTWGLGCKGIRVGLDAVPCEFLDQ